MTKGRSVSSHVWRCRVPSVPSFSPQRAALLLGLRVATIYDAIARGSLPAESGPNGRKTILLSDLTAWRKSINRKVRAAAS